MLDIGRLLEQVRSQLDGEAVEKINGALKEIQNGVADLVDDYKSVSSESKKRKLEIRALKSDLESATVERDEFKEKLENSDVTEELESLRGFKSETVKRQKDGFLKRFETIKSHKNFKNAESFFDVPEKIEEMTDEQLEKNVAELSRLDTLNYFGDSSTADAHGDQVGGADKSLLDKINEAKSIEELQQIQEEAS